MFEFKHVEGEGASPKARSIALVAGTLAIAAALFAYGFSVSCSQEDPVLQDDQTTYEDTSAGTDYSGSFYGEENWSFMSEESLLAFESSFYPWLLERGLEDGAYVYLHSEDIACEDGVWQAYARTPVDDAYYKVTFDASTKELTFEKVMTPEFAKRAESERIEVQVESGNEVSRQDSEAPADRRDASQNIPIDDADAFASKLPAKAASALPGIIVEYAAGKGVETTPALCSIYPSSIKASGQAVSFEVLAYDPQKNAYVISADYDETADRFGLSIRAL